MGIYRRKWNDAWLSNKDCDGDGLLDRHYGLDSYRGSGAWLTNHQSGEYEVDGIVIYNNKQHKLVSGKNPKYAFAFKSILTHEQAEVIVNDVEWNVSMHKYMKPIKCL